MPKYEDYPFYNLLLERVSEPGNKVINAVKDKIGSVVDYDTASDLVTYNPKEYSFDVYRAADIADNLMLHIDEFKDNVDAINSYIKRWDKYIHKVTISPLGCTTFLFISNENFVDSDGFLDYGYGVSHYDEVVMNSDIIEHGSAYDPNNNRFMITVRLGETYSMFKKTDYPLITKLIEDSGLDYGSLDEGKNDDLIISDNGDIEIIINANRPEEEID